MQTTFHQWLIRQNIRHSTKVLQYIQMSLSCLDYPSTCRQFFLIKRNTINVLQLPAVIHKHLGHLTERLILLSIALQPGTKGLNLCKRRVVDGAILSRCSDIFSQVWGGKKDCPPKAGKGSPSREADSHVPTQQVPCLL